HHHVAPAYLERRLRRQVPSRPHLLAMSLASDPTAHELAFIGVSARVVIVEVEEAGIEQVSVGRKESFRSNCELWQPRNAAKIRARNPRTLGWVHEREGLILGEAVEVTGQARAQPRDAILRVEGNAPIAWIGLSILGAGGEDTAQETVNRDRRARP